MEKIKKKCEVYNNNPNCEKTLLVEPKHLSRRKLCYACQRLKDNNYEKIRQRKVALEKRLKKISELKKLRKVETDEKKVGELTRRINIMSNFI